MSTSGSINKNFKLQKAAVRIVSGASYNSHTEPLFKKLEILTLPRILLSSVDVAQSRTTTIEIPQAGLAVISKPGEGAGSIFLEEKGTLVWVCNLQENLTQENLVLQPGSYRVEWRSKNAKESIYTEQRQFKVESGSTVSIHF